MTDRHLCSFKGGGLLLMVSGGVGVSIMMLFKKIGYAMKLNIMMLEWSFTQFWSPGAWNRKQRECEWRRPPHHTAQPLLPTHRQPLVPDLQEAVPGPCSHGHAVIGHAQAADPVIVTGQDACESRQTLRTCQTSAQGSSPSTSELSQDSPIGSAQNQHHLHQQTHHFLCWSFMH